MFQLEGMSLTIRFDQKLIDWLNVNYPERNFFVAAPSTFKAGDLTCKNVLKSEKWKMGDFVYGPDIFFKLVNSYSATTEYEMVQEEELKELEKFLHALAKWLLKIEFDKGEQKNIYLGRVTGEIRMLDDQSYVGDITDKSLGLVGVEWELYGIV